MAENLTVARPYAQAVFDLACEHKDLDGWQNMLFALSEATKNDYFLAVLKNSPNSTIAADNLITLLKGLLNENGQNFVRVLGENNRFEVLPEIYAEYVRLREKHDKVLTVELVSARTLGAADVQALTSKLAKKYDAKINLKKVIDPSIMGGVIIKIGDEVIDVSVKTRLTDLSTTLK